MTMNVDHPSAHRLAVCADLQGLQLNDDLRMFRHTNELVKEEFEELPNDQEF
jgi:hypothetical protein